MNDYNQIFLTTVSFLKFFDEFGPSSNTAMYQDSLRCGVRLDVAPTSIQPVATVMSQTLPPSLLAKLLEIGWRVQQACIVGRDDASWRECFDADLLGKRALQYRRGFQYELVRIQ